ncbi:heterokaryon incompatibility protein-domain-containing protein [Paraphoma chrysanthemicola]|uniref:Heterokaryon incompatibility protein-domain-containing protein n=1 Tax=Paraphoma chrysanthemicola TaxID=798071 RepID=A0A8K0RB13_9PLEO|nr:heterokaryon incompatibility protein-domain-containing protein [Paraphoma chrysanthemicola]
MASLTSTGANGSTITAEIILDDALDLCEPCLELTKWLFTNRYYRLFKSFVRASREATCRFCEWILEQFLHIALPDNLPAEGLLCELEARCWRSCLQGEYDLNCYAEVRIGGTLESIKLALWENEEDPDHVSPADTYADREDSLRVSEERFRIRRRPIFGLERQPAPATLVRRPPIIGADFQGVITLAQRWMDECQSHHTDCPTIVDMCLPTRVLSVSGELDAPSVKLLATDGRSGRYLALSHCWGPVDKQPLVTTSENYQEHLKGIHFDTLPKTFRDAVQFALHIGISYVWIDSLCIIQKDDDDWNKEAKRMRDVYQNAALVLSASGAKDSSEGFFITNRPRSVVQRVPKIYNGIQKGVFNIASLPPGRSFPTEGPLYRRAWALQEWYLARRVIVFMPGGISWICNGVENSMGERGQGASLFLMEKLSWLDLLREYTGKRLTYPKDRIKAIEGIVADMRLSRQDDFLSKYGVWHDELIMQLLWMFQSDKETSELDALKLPTWSWAASGGAKHWGPDSEFYGGQFQDLCERLEVTASGHIHAVGGLSSTSLTLLESSKGPTPYYEGTEDNIWTAYESNEEGYKGYRSERCWFIWDASLDTPILGIFRSDHEAVSANVRCFVALSSNQRTTEDIPSDKMVTKDLPLSDATTIDLQRSAVGEGSMPLEEPSGSSRSEETQDCKESIDGQHIAAKYDLTSDADMQASSECSPLSSKYNNVSVEELEKIWTDTQDNSLLEYFVLILEPAGKDKYKRVGMGLLYQHAYEALGVKVEEFEII